MAAVNSSSRIKFSSSMKKKRSKNSSEVRKRRKSRSRTRKSLKSKKVRRRDVSLSSSDDDDSRMDDDSVSVTSSDSEGDYRRGRARSRTRRKLKGSRKRGRSEGSSSDSPRRRKKKGLKRSQDSKKKKKQKKKRTSGRSRRDVSVDSGSSGSWSCSTCRGGSSSSEGSESERSRGRSEVRKKGKRTFGRTKDEEGRYKHRSRSISSCSGYDNQSGYLSEEELPNLNDSRRLRSVITVISRNDETEERHVSKEEEKVDTIQDYDDWPSPGSNGRYEGCRKESSEQITSASEKKGCTYDAKVTKDKDFSGETIDDRYKDHDVVDCGQINSSGDAIRSTIDEFKDEECTGPSEGEDLELILRQKALENLRKFRGGLNNKRTTGGDNPKNENNGEQSCVATVKVEQSSDATVKVEQSSDATVKVEQSEESSKKVAGNGQMVVKDAENVSLPMVDKRITTCSANCNRNPNENGALLKSKAIQDEGGLELDACNLSSNRINAVKAIISNKSCASIENNSNLSTSLSKKMNSTYNSPDVQSEAKNVANINVPVTERGNAVSTEANKAHAAAASDASLLTPVTAQDAANKPGNSAGSSQYEEKTMSVMRGGELVQVSYKVYIPKKPPALARRQLNRPSDLQ